MGTVVAAEAKLVVRLDTTKAEADAAKLPVGGKERTEVQPRQGADTAAATRTSPDAPFDPVEHGKGLAKATWGGGLYEQVKRTVVSLPVPGLGTAVEVAEFSRRYGPAATQALKSAAEHIGDPETRAAVTAALAATDEKVRALAATMDGIQVELDTIGQTVSEVKDLAVGAAALGGVDPSEMPAFGADTYTVNRFVSNEQRVRERRSRAFLGQAVGDAGGATLDRLFGRGSIR
jgi:hypothetical protein